MSLLPSLFTLANLFCGWACVVYAMRGELATAAPFIGVAMVLDMLDGRIARMTGTTSEFGVQLDSLADLISFGMAPAVLAYAWGWRRSGGIGWAVGFLFVTAAALRLARFNIQRAHTDKRYFVGLAESGRRRDCRRHGVLFHDPEPGPARRITYLVASTSARLSRLRSGARAGAADGEHDSLPELQDARSAREAPLHGAGRARGVHRPRRRVSARSAARSWRTATCCPRFCGPRRSRSSDIAITDDGVAASADGSA